ncbi:hypothetical protein SAMN05519103_08584 [Rhizobiales bacterium GAS113]|nr:hypothetical protein SAMN05519103_08584 [Rhizobiales bacterium GAS113]
MAHDTKPCANVQAICRLNCRPVSNWAAIATLRVNRRGVPTPDRHGTNSILRGLLGSVAAAYSHSGEPTDCANAPIIHVLISLERVLSSFIKMLGFGGPGGASAYYPRCSFWSGDAAGPGSTTEFRRRPELPHPSCLCRSGRMRDPEARSHLALRPPIIIGSADIMADLLGGGGAFPVAWLCHLRPSPSLRPHRAWSWPVSPVFGSPGSRSIAVFASLAAHDRLRRLACRPAYR